MSWTLRHKSGEEIFAIDDIEYSGTFMGERYVFFDMVSPVPISFAVGDYLEYRSERFELNYIPTVEKNASSGSYGEAFVYKGVKLNSASDELTRCDFLDYVLSDNNLHFTGLPTFSFYCQSVKDLADRIQANLNRIYTGSQKWTVQLAPGVTSKDLSLSADKIKCWDALKMVKDNFDLQFFITGRTITIGGEGTLVGTVFQYGKDKGLYQLTQTSNDTDLYLTRLRAYGNTRNLPDQYYSKLAGSLIPASMYVKNLQLPGFAFAASTTDIESGYALNGGAGSRYIDSLQRQTLIGIRESTVFFDGSDTTLDDIYPSIEGMTAEDLAKAGISIVLDAGVNGNLDEIISAEQITDDGVIPTEGSGTTLKATFTMTLKDIGFDINNYLTTTTATINMKSGKCVGREFEITSVKKSGNNYVLTCNRYQDNDLGLAFPYKDYNLAAGDKFVLLNIEMPEVYVKAAEQRLQNAALAYIKKNDKPRYVYTPKIDEIFMAEHPEIKNQLQEGKKFSFTDSDLALSEDVYIQKLTIKEHNDKETEYDVSLSNEPESSFIERLQQSIGSGISSNGGGGNGVGFSEDSLRQFILAWGSQYFLSKIKADTAQGKITHAAGVDFGPFASGSAGTGGRINERGEGELESLSLRSFLEVPELRYNRTLVIHGEQWCAPGGGIIQSVDPTTRIATLKLENGEDISIEAGDVCKTIYNTGNGFKTLYFNIAEVYTSTGQFKYDKREQTQADLMPGMHFVAYTSFTNPNRRKSAYMTKEYTRFLSGVSSWDILPENIMLQLGDLSGLTINGTDMKGYSAFLNRIFMTGVIKQISQDGVTTEYLPFYKGDWVQGTYAYYDEVTHNGSMWLCVNTAGTLQEPTDTSDDWAQVSAKGKDAFSLSIIASAGADSYRPGTNYSATLTASIMEGTNDITQVLNGINPNLFVWTRTTKNTESDAIWNAEKLALQTGYQLSITETDLIGDTHISLTVYDRQGKTALAMANF